MLTTLGIHLQYFLIDRLVKYIFCKFLQEYCVVYCELYASRGCETLLFKVQQNSCNPEVDTLDILILWQLSKIVPMLEGLARGVPSTTRTSAMKIPNPWSPDPLASLIGTEETPESIEGALMPLKWELKEISKWNTPLISHTAQVRSSNKKLLVRTQDSVGTV